MFEVGFQEIVMIALLALIVLGPEKLPKLAAKIGHWTGRARVMARNLRTQLEQEVSYEELLQQKKEAEDALRKAQEAPMNFHADLQATAQSVQNDLASIHDTQAQPAAQPAIQPDAQHDTPTSSTDPVTPVPVASESIHRADAAGHTELPANTDVASQHAVPASSTTS